VTPSPLTIWAVSDGRAGIEAQALGLAEAVGRRRPAEVIVKRIGWRGGLGRLPWRLNLFGRTGLTSDSGIAPPWPDIWIACGRATLPLSTRLRRWSQGRTFVVQLQAPKAPASLFDLVIPPEHDRLTGPNVVPIVGSPNRLTPERLAGDYARFAAQLSALPAPRVAVVIGGKSKAHDLSPARARTMGAEISEAVRAAGGSVMVTFSRRTPADAEAELKAALSPLPSVIWDGQGENPYFAYLAAADAILVTEDSTNMATDAASTGKPVQVLAMDGRSAKLDRFHADLAARGVSRPFGGAFESWSYPPLAETERAASETLRRYDARRGDASGG
jgi:uncharacterized protein